MIAARRPVRVPCLAHGWRRARTEWRWPSASGGRLARPAALAPCPAPTGTDEPDAQ